MPPTIPNQDAWLVAQLAQLKRDVAALKAQQTQYVIDASGTPQVIVGNISMLPSGAPTGYSGFGIASFQAKNNGWIAPTLINSWVPTGALPLAQPGYLKDPLGFVHLKGRVKGGTTGTAAFVLPAGFRPGSTDFYSMAQGSLVVSLAAIDSAGNVVIDSTSTTDNALGGITFLAEN